MDSNTHSAPPPQPQQNSKPPEPRERPDRLAGLPAVVEGLAAQDLDWLSDTEPAEDILERQRQADHRHGQWLRRLAALDAPGGRRRRPRPAGALNRQLAAHPAPGWARGGPQHRPDRPGPVRWPLVETADALPSGQISPAHARVLAHGTRQLPDHVAADAEPVLVEAAARLDPPLLRQAVGYLVEVADPPGADAAHQRRHERRGLWLAPTLDHMVASTGSWTPKPATPCRRPWNRWPAPPTSAPPTPWPSWAAAPSRVGGCPRPVGSGPSCWSRWT